MSKMSHPFQATLNFNNAVLTQNAWVAPLALGENLVIRQNLPPVLVELLHVE